MTSLIKRVRRVLRRMRQGRGGAAEAGGELTQGLCGIEPLESERGFRLSGDIDIYSGDALREALERELHGTLVVDLSAVEFIDESGLAVLLQAHKRLHDHGGSMILRRPRGQVMKVFEVTGVAELPGLTVESDGPYS